MRHAAAKELLCHFVGFPPKLGFPSPAGFSGAAVSSNPVK